MTKHIPENRQIYVSARIWHEVLPKFDLSPFIYALHEEIDLKRYGTGLEKFYFSFIIMPEPEEINLPYHRFSPETKEADVAVAIPYDTAMSVDAAELVVLMEQAYLEGIAQLSRLNIRHFDTDALKADVTALFEQEGWYEAALCA